MQMILLFFACWNEEGHLLLKKQFNIQWHIQYAKPASLVSSGLFVCK